MVYFIPTAVILIFGLIAKNMLIENRLENLESRMKQLEEARSASNHEAND